jgi:translation initiation factor 2-alpha kinase 3
VLVKGANLWSCSNNSEFSASRVPSQSIAALSSGIQSIQLDLERDLNKQFTLERRATSTGEEHFDSSIVFSDSVSKKDSTDPHNVKHEDDSPKAIQSMFRKPGEESDSTEDATDEIEEIPRVEIAETVDVDDLVINEDFVLFIKMTPYPVTLDDFIVSKLPIGTLNSVN